MKRETLMFIFSFLMLCGALGLVWLEKGPAALPDVAEKIQYLAGKQDACPPVETIAPAVTTASQSAPTNADVPGKVLNLSDRNLDQVPSYVFDMTSLEELDVSHNALTGAIPSQVGQLRNLKVLDASFNRMIGVPAEVGQLSKLEVLDLSHNQLTGLPNELGNLKNLKTLDLSGNAYSEQDLAGIRAKLPSTNFILQ